MPKLTIEISRETIDVLVDLVEKSNGAAVPRDDLHALATYVLTSIADGWRRPGSWERGVLQQMGLAP